MNVLLPLLLSLLITCTALQPVMAHNSAPVAENLKLQTYRGITMSGELRAADPEGDRLTYTLQTPPMKGTIVLHPDGRFTYTPRKNAWGKDYFGYTATDSAGNVSHEATVIIRLRRMKTKVFYADLLGHRAQYAAAWLAEHNLLMGETLGAQRYFFPDAPITRLEFAALCATMGDVPSPADDERYAPITLAQAAAQLAQVMDLHTASVVSLPANTPSWAKSALRSLIACRILSCQGNPDRLLSRAEAAQMLVRAMQLRDAQR